MQTFLPYPEYCESAQALDDKRLGNQFYREGLTLLRGKWANHPAAKMWAGHHFHLGLYLLACAEELKNRGRYYPGHIYEVCVRMQDAFLHGDMDPPPWLGDDAFHASHRSNLLRKDPEHYGEFGWAEPDDLPYIWPGG